ncbi:MAG: hypothetical protein KJO95_02595 [Gammaproteobacteria bacterium]|nr:hypothetical protein [Gammaproteobacteria bacterium]NNC56233.1 hypothetical protein [Woeseiaceae bacterium]
MNEALQTELLAMADRDERVRSELASTGELFDGYNARMAAVHEQNAKEIARVIEQYGWPGVSLVGNEGMEAACLVLQHAIANPELQRKCLPLLKKAAEIGDVPAVHVAYLEDRICCFEGRPQRYGTQFDWDVNGALSPQPLEDPQQVDRYRESVGLGPLSEKTREMRSRAAADGQERPRDFHERQKEMDAWARSVGWR